MRASVERRRAEEARKQARREEIGGILGAILAGLAMARPFVIYTIIY